jgi:hypothetical protein
VVESTALEMRHTRKGIAGSNPALSAKVFYQSFDRQEFPAFSQRNDPTFVPTPGFAIGAGFICTWSEIDRKFFAFFDHVRWCECSPPL